MQIQLTYHRGGKNLKFKFSYMAGGERIILSFNEAVGLLVSYEGLTEDDAKARLNEIKDATDLPMRNFTFSCKAPVLLKLGDDVAVADPETVRRYFQDSNKFANNVTEIEHWFAGVEELIYRWFGSESEKLGRQIVRVQARIDELEDYIGRQRQKLFARVRLDEEEAELKELRPKKRELESQQKAARKSEKSDAKSPVSKLVAAAKKKAEAKKTFLNTRPEWSHLDRGTRAARRRHKKRRKGGLPHFRKTRGDSSIEVQIPNGMDVTELFSHKYTSGLVRVIPSRRTIVPIGKHWGYDPTIVLFRLGSQPGTKKPLWAAFPTHQHRDIPSYGRVKTVQVSKKSNSLRDRYKVTFAVESKHGFGGGRAGDGIAVVDFGWRLLPDGDLRVAYWRDTKGSGELTLPAKVLNMLRKAEHIQSVRDTLFNETRDALCGWLKCHPVPAWLAAATTHLHAWRSQARLRELVRAWQKFDGDSSLYSILDNWRSRDDHLNAYADGLRESVQNIRLDRYRKFAAFLRNRNWTIGIEDGDWAKLARKAPMEADAQGQIPRWQMRVAAPGLLSECLRAGGQYILLDPKNTTRTCHACSHVNDCLTQKVVQKCANCGAVWDRDVNSTENMWNQLWDIVVRGNMRPGKIKDLDVVEPPLEYTGDFNSDFEVREGVLEIATCN